MLTRKHIYTILSASVLIITALVMLLCGQGPCGNGKYQHPRRGPLVDAVYALGTVKSDRVFTVKLGVQATVRLIPVIEGQEVSPGSALMVLDTGAAITTPIGGTVTSIHCEEGETAMPGAPLLTVTDLRKRFIQVSLDQNAALRVRKGQEVRVSLESIRSLTLHGKVESVYPSNGQFLARIGTGHIPPEILPDMTADVAIIIARRENALMVPLSSLHDGELTVIRRRVPLRVRPAIGTVDGAWAELLDDSVRPDDRILVPR